MRSYTEDDDNIDDDDESSKAEGFRLLLGDDIITSLDASAWDNESVHSDVEDTTTTISENKILSGTAISMPHRSTIINTKDIVNDQKYDDYMFSLAYTTNENNSNSLGLPKVGIVNFGGEKGNGLISLQDFCKGSVLYTERPIIATPADYSSSVTCCFNCFQSLEYITTCQGLFKQQKSQQDHSSNEIDNVTIETNSDSTEFPCPNLWPVLPLTWKNSQNTKESLVTSDTFRVDLYGRLQCVDCEKIFCSDYCRKTFMEELGSCCYLSRSISTIPEILIVAKSSNNQLDHEDSSCNDIGTINDTATEVQCEVLLAVRMFAYELQRHRRLTSNNNFSSSLLTGLCGIESDLNDLQIGIGTRSIDVVDANTTVDYSLEPIYKKLIEVYSLSKDEQVVLPYSKLVLFAVQAARNGFGIIPQSPFQTYYNSLVRVSGRGTSKHEMITEQVTTALGVSKLDRTMDTIINQHVSVQLAAIFPLTARINHSCAPYCNAEVQSGQYVNYNIDLVATQDIQTGEEIFISYIEGSHRKRYNSRQRELYARYLFNCKCYSCQNG
jgi:SET domain